MHVTKRSTYKTWSADPPVVHLQGYKIYSGTVVVFPNDVKHCILELVQGHSFLGETSRPKVPDRYTPDTEFIDGT